MRHLKTKKRLSGFLTNLGNLRKVSRIDICLRANPAATHGVDEGGGDVLGHVLQAHSTGGDEPNAGEGAGQSLHGTQTAVHVCREKFHDLQTVLDGHHNLGRSGAAGRDGNIVLYTPCHGLLVIAGGDDELSTTRNGKFGLLKVYHRSGTHQHIRAIFIDCLDGICGGCRAERDLHHINAASQHCFGSGNCLRRIIQNNHRHYAAHGKSL